MTDQTPEKVPPPDRAAGKPPAPQDRVEALRAQLAEAEAALPAPEGHLRVRVRGVPWFQAGQHLIGSTWQDVHAGVLPAIEEAARAAGVELETAVPTSTA